MISAQPRIMRAGRVCHENRLVTPMLLPIRGLCPFVLLGLIASAQATPEQLARKAFPSVVMIVTADSGGQPLALGSGFFVRNGVVATNLHVIRGAASGHVKIIGRSGTYPIKGTLAVDAAADLALLRVGGLHCGSLGTRSAWNLDAPAAPVGAAVVQEFRAYVARVGTSAQRKRLSAMSDARLVGALLKNPGVYRVFLSKAIGAMDWNCPPSLPLSGSGLPAIGDAVFAVGNPEGLEGTFSDGIVSGIRSGGDQSRVQITAPISPGSSGGPVLDSEGRVAGVAEATLQGGQELNFAVPARYLSTLLGNASAAAAPLSALALPPEGGSSGPQVGADLLSGVTAGQFRWSDRPDWAGASYPYPYSFTVVNRLGIAVQNVDILVIFYDSDGSPVDSGRTTVAGPILPGSAKRAHGTETESVEQLAGEWNDPSDTAFLPDSTRVKFRVLDFRVVR